MSDRPEPSRPVPTLASKAQIDALAESVARKLNFKPGDAIAPVIAKLGGRIDYHSASDTPGPPESMVVYGPRNFVIHIPTTTSRRRDRFTIAHELGHYLLHYPLARARAPNVPMRATRWVDETQADQQRAEWEANWFAAGFLMPATDFRQRWRELRGHEIEMASWFDVSVPAIQVRVKNLNLAL